MGKFGCTCGNAISLNSIPEMQEAFLITDIALDDVVGDGVETDLLPKRVVYECDECGRLWIQPAPRSRGEFLSYVPEGDKLKFFQDYGKGYKADPPPDPKLFEPEPGEIEWRRCFIPTPPATLSPHTRQIVKSYEMTNPFRPERAVVPPNTPETVILHSMNLVRPMPLVHVFGLDNDDPWGGLRNLRQEVIGRVEKKIGETIDFDLENTGDEPVEIKIVISGLAKVPPAAKKVCCRCGSVHVKPWGFSFICAACET